MTSRMPNRNQSASRNAEQARFAVEALFHPRRAIGETADVDVVVKRRRIAPTDNRVNGKDAAEVVADEVRTPRIYTIEKQQQQEGQEPSGAKPDGQSRLGVAVSSSEVMPLRRRRRRLNGEVTIIRPPSQAVGDEPTESRRNSLGDARAQGSDLGRFGVDMETQRRHEKLLARIALLERQAQRAQNTEAATAVRWIKKAINKYGIKAVELGL